MSARVQHHLVEEVFQEVKCHRKVLIFPIEQLFKKKKKKSKEKHKTQYLIYELFMSATN